MPVLTGKAQKETPMFRNRLIAAAALLVAAVVAGAGVIAAGSAGASPSLAASPSQSPAPGQVSGEVVQAPGAARAYNCHCDVEGFRPAWHTEERPPPLRPLLRPYVLVKVHATPRVFNSRMTLYHMKLVMTRRGLRWEPRRVKGATVARQGLGDLPRPGEHVVWRLGGGIFPDWPCARGRYLLVWSGTGTSSTGNDLAWHYYSPFLRGHEIGDTGWGTLPPTETEAIHIRRC